MTELADPLWRDRLHGVLYPEERRIPAERDNARQDFRDASLVLQNELGPGRFFLGERLFVADVIAAHTLYWAAWTDQLADFPGLQAYAARCLCRPACPDSLKG